MLPLYVEVSPLLSQHLTGIGRFVARLVQALAPLTPLRLFSTLTRAQALEARLSPTLTAGHALVIDATQLPTAGDVAVWTRQLLARTARLSLHSEAARCPALFTAHHPGHRFFRREIGVLYDFTPMLLPWAHSEGTRKHYGRFFGQTSALFDKAVAISHSTAADAGWLCALPSSDVNVAYPGPSLCQPEHVCQAPVAHRSNLVLVVSTWEPRKNGEFLLEWFRSTKVLPEDMELWWVGARGWWCEGPSRWWRRVRGTRKVRFLGAVSDERLCRLYRQAAFTVYPSLYEGFGFPVLDSLLHGTPVLCGYNSSLQEFAGRGVHYFNACDPETLDAAYAEFLEAARLGTCPVPALVELHRRYSWEKLAQTVLDLCHGRSLPSRAISPALLAE
jgi:glycosyltransferase involved in cell wall biosynthesis